MELLISHGNLFLFDEQIKLLDHGSCFFILLIINLW